MKTASIETDGGAVYVRWTLRKPAKTLVVENPIVTVDVDDAGEIVGIEIIGVRVQEKPARLSTG